MASDALLTPDEIQMFREAEALPTWIDERGIICHGRPDTHRPYVWMENVDADKDNAMPDMQGEREA